MSTPDIPTRIGRYEVDRLLGTGAMGLVYLGRDPELDRPVAIKTVRDLDLEPEAKATFLDRFRNEARAAARLHHPSIVQVYDVGEDDKLGPFLVFEYVPGSSLKQVLRSEGPLPPARLLALAGQVAEAIDTAHAAGIIHRDIKPDNLLLTSDGRTKLADFGVARVPNAALTREGQFLGTPCYAAPETLERARYGVASDLFSFAAVLYEALSGVRAFPGDDAVAVAHKVIHEAPAPPSKVSREAPAEADGPLLRGLAKHPGDRPSSARALVAELAEALAAAGRIDRRHAAEITSGATLLDAGRTRGGRSPASALAFFAVLLGALGVGVALVLSFGDGVGTGGATELARLFGAAVQVDAGTTRSRGTPSRPPPWTRAPWTSVTRRPPRTRTPTKRTPAAGTSSTPGWPSTPGPPRSPSPPTSGRKRRRTPWPGRAGRWPTGPGTSPRPPWPTRGASTRGTRTSIGKRRS